MSALTAIGGFVVDKLIKGVWKGHGGGATAIVLELLNGNAFVDGLQLGLAGGMGDLGAAVGSWLSVYVIGFLVTWIAPANKAAGESAPGKKGAT